MHTSSCTRGTRQHGGNAEAGFCYSQDLLLLSLGVSTGRPGPEGARRPLPTSEGSAGLRRSRQGEPSAAENVTLAPGCRLSGQSTARVSLASVHTGVPPTAAVLLAMPCVHVLGGNRAQSIRGHKAALPGASPSGGQCLTQKCTGIWGSAAAEGPSSLAGAALGGPLVGPSREPSPACATLRAGGCLLCPVHVSARKLDWVLSFFTSSF